MYRNFAYNTLILYVTYAAWSVQCLELPDHRPIEELDRMLIEERQNQAGSIEQLNARFHSRTIDFIELDSQQKDGLCNLVIGTMFPCVADIEIIPPTVNWVAVSEWTPVERRLINNIGISKNMFPCVRRKINFNYAQLMKNKHKIPEDDGLESFLLGASVIQPNTVYAFKQTGARVYPKFRMTVDTTGFLPYDFIDKEIKEYTTVHIQNDRVVGSY